MKRLKLIVLMAALLAMVSTSAMAITVGTGSEKGVFYPLGQEICGRAAEQFLPCDAIVSGGSNFNVTNTKSGELGGGLAMLPVAQASGLAYKVLKVGEGAFITANQTASERVQKLVGGMEAAVFPAALKLATKGRVVFVTIGEGSGETKVMREQLAQAGAPESALIVVADQAEFIKTLLGRNDAFGFFTRIPKPDNALFVEIRDKEMHLMGAYNPAFKNPATKVQVVEVAGFTVKTPVTPVAFVYKDDNAEAVEVSVIAEGVLMADLVPKKEEKKTGKMAGWWAKMKGYASTMTAMSSEKIAEMNAAIKEKVANMNL